MNRLFSPWTSYGGTEAPGDPNLLICTWCTLHPCPAPFFLVYSLSFPFFDGIIVSNVVYFPTFSPTSNPLLPATSCSFLSHLPYPSCPNPLFFPTSYNQLHEGSWHCNFVDCKMLRLCNIYVPSPDIRVVRVARRYPEGVRSTEVRKGVFYDDNDNIYVIHRRQEILVLLTLNFTHYILLYTILKLLCCDCPFLFWFLAVERTVVTTWCSVWNMVM